MRRLVRRLLCIGRRGAARLREAGQFVGKALLDRATRACMPLDRGEQVLVRVNAVALQAVLQRVMDLGEIVVEGRELLLGLLDLLFRRFHAIGMRMPPILELLRILLLVRHDATRQSALDDDAHALLQSLPRHAHRVRIVRHGVAQRHLVRIHERRRRVDHVLEMGMRTTQRSRKSALQARWTCLFERREAGQLANEVVERLVHILTSLGHTCTGQRHIRQLLLETRNVAAGEGEMGIRVRHRDRARRRARRRDERGRCLAPRCRVRAKQPRASARRRRGLWLRLPHGPVPNVLQGADACVHVAKLLDQRRRRRVVRPERLIAIVRLDQAQRLAMHAQHRVLRDVGKPPAQEHLKILELRRRTRHPGRRQRQRRHDHARSIACEREKVARELRIRPLNALVRRAVETGDVRGAVELHTHAMHRSRHDDVLKAQVPRRALVPTRWRRRRRHRGSGGGATSYVSSSPTRSVVSVEDDTRIGWWG